MSSYMEATSKKKCPCCKIPDSNSGFQKILDLKKSGLVLYRHTNRIDEINKNTGLLESSIETADDVFILQNMNDSKINAVDYVSRSVENISCPRCRELVQRAQKYLKNISTIDNKDIISVCNHCKAKQQTQNYCNECRKAVKKFFVEQDKKSIVKEKIKAWLTKIQNFLRDMSTVKMSRNLLQSRAYSEFYLNHFFQDNFSLDVTPMPLFKTGVKILDMVRSINKEICKSESALILMDNGIIKNSKNASTIKESSHRMEILESSSILTHDTSLKHIIHAKKEKQDSSEIFKVLGRANKFEHKNIERKTSQIIKKYYSAEDLFVTTDDLADGELNKMFSYVFPKKGSKKTKHLRRVKTSTELIIDTREMLRQRAFEKSIQQEHIREATSSKREKKTGSVKSKEKVAKKDLGKEEVTKRVSTPFIKNGTANAYDKKEKTQIDKVNKKNTEKSQKLKKIRHKESQIQLKEKTDEIDKEKKLRLVEKQNVKKEQLKRENEEKQKLKHELQKAKGDKLHNVDNKEKNKEKQQKVEVNLRIANLKNGIDDQAKQYIDPIQKQLNEENKRAKMTSNMIKEESEKKSKIIDERNNDKKNVQEKSKTPEDLTTKELNITQVKMRRPSTDDLILKLVKLKQSNKNNEVSRLRLSDMNVTPLMINEHKIHKGRKSLTCAMCEDSDLELDVENIVNKKNQPEKITDIIVGNTIMKYKLPLSEKDKKEEVVPILYKSVFEECISPVRQKELAEMTMDKIDRKTGPSLSHKNVEQELPKGVIRYALSDRTFIDKGWTMLPTEKVVRKINVYRMRPAHPEFDWFDRNKNKGLMLYDTGEKLAEFDDNGRGRWFYRNGKLALDYYDAEEMNAQQRLVIYGSGEPDERGRYQPIAILATFDYLGNGVVFDHTGKIRLKYNQTEGIVLDRKIGPVSHWKWHTLNDPPVLQQVMIDTQVAHKDPDILKLGGPGDDKVRPDNEEMLAIEFDNFIKEKSKKLTQKFKPFQIKTKALKINEHFSLRVLDQANIYLIFRDGTTNIKMNIGMVLDHQEIVDTDTAEVGEVSNSLERFPARTDSLAGLQRSVAYAQRVERLRVERERRLRHPEPNSSADQLVAAASHPLKLKLNNSPSSSTQSNICYCKCRKPSAQNMYYDTRLV